MMKNRWLYATLLQCCLLFIFTDAASQLQKIYFNPKAAGSEKQSQFVDSIRFIPLETRDDVRLEGYNNITVAANNFLVIDYTEKVIFLYAKDGRYLRKINYKKLGEFYPAYQQNTNQIVFFGDNKNYSLTPKDRIKIKLDWDNPRNKKYFKKYTIDLADTTFSIKQETPTENDLNGAYYFFDDYYWQGSISTSPLYKDSLDYEIKIYRDKKLVKKFFPYNRINEPRFLYRPASSGFSQTNKPDEHFITRPYCDTVYRMVKDSLFPAYQLVLPLENSLPASFYSQPFKNKTDRENFDRNNGWMFRQVHGFYETPQFVFFIAGFLSNTKAYVYNKATKVTYSAGKIKADSSQYNLSLLADYGFERKGNRFYKTQKAGDLMTFFQQHKTVAVPKELEAFLNSKPHNDALVVVEFQFKN